MRPKIFSLKNEVKKLTDRNNKQADIISDLQRRVAELNVCLISN